MVGPKSPWMGEFTAGNPDHPVFGGRGSLRENLDELSNDHSDGHRLAMGVNRFGFGFANGKPKNQDWINSKDPGEQMNVVPIPSAVWLMLSGLFVIGYRAKSRILKNDSHAITEA
ncbi:MAG: hypothetical protein GQ538_12610 [Xanthomonadales bacterium]|nr:hypothetical protein [Xanthomonadales bacterium]